jgi:hypothetical protein
MQSGKRLTLKDYFAKHTRTHKNHKNTNVELLLSTVNCQVQLFFDNMVLANQNAKLTGPDQGILVSPLVLTLKPWCYPSEDSAVRRSIGASCEEIIYIDSKKCFCMYSIWCYWSIVDTVTDKCQWLEYLLIDILNTDEVLYALSVFPCLRFPCSEMLVKLASWRISDMTQNRFFIRYAS